MAGLVGDVFGKIPEVGEQMEFNGYTLTVLKKTEQNIESIRLQLVINPDDAVDLH